jgi:hypothetical protein
MYRLNVSFAVEPAVSDSWTGLMRERFIPLLRGSGFGRLALSRVLHERNEGHFTFSLLVELDDMAAYHRFTGELWSEYLRLSEGISPENLVWFMSLMKEIE